MHSKHVTPPLPCPLFAPLGELLARVPEPGPEANALLSALLPRWARSGGGVALRFVEPRRDGLGYEARIYARGEIATRPGSWHDLFNAMVWIRFPRTKAALNARHWRELASAGGREACGRGPVRDAATQFDESGIIAAAADPALLELLARREWEALFCARRGEVRERMRFFVFGHGLYDSLRSPFRGLCGKAALVEVPDHFPAEPVASQLDWLDAELSARFRDPTQYAHARAFHALPVLGIPGVTADSEDSRYYADRSQFRPLPAPK